MKTRLAPFFLALLACAAFLSIGCNTPDPENRSARPWNSPNGYETGLPSSMFEGR
jgi:hypothetical protein